MAKIDIFDEKGNHFVKMN